MTHAPVLPTSTSARQPALGDAMIAELTREAATTRRLLERVPEERFGWRPHARSMSLGQLALHLAVLPLGVTNLVEQLRVGLPTVPLPEPASRAELLATLEGSVAHATQRLAAWTDEDLAAEWTLQRDGVPLMALPRGEVLRALLLNHSYHHRGQLTVYLRLLDVPLPPVYGPTADENPLA